MAFLSFRIDCLYSRRRSNFARCSLVKLKLNSTCLFITRRTTSVLFDDDCPPVPFDDVKSLDVDGLSPLHLLDDDTPISGGSLGSASIPIVRLGSAMGSLLFCCPVKINGTILFLERSLFNLFLSLRDTLLGEGLLCFFLWRCFFFLALSFFFEILLLSLLEVQVRRR